jgi:hypothetical protein
VDLVSKKLEHHVQIAQKLFPRHHNFVLVKDITVTIVLIEFLRAMEQFMIMQFNQNFEQCAIWLVMFEKRFEV